MLCRCGTSGTNRKPRPELDRRKQSTLDPLERLLTPYDWLMSPKCRDQVGGHIRRDALLAPAGAAASGYAC